jgi:hypothetical protein
VGIGVADIDMGICNFWHCGFLLHLPVMLGSTHFIIQQSLPQVGSEMQGPRM